MVATNESGEDSAQITGGPLEDLIGYHLRRASSVFGSDFAQAMEGTGLRQVLFGILSVNPAANVLHLVIGAALVGVAFTQRAPLLDAIAGTLLLALGIAGLFIITTPFNVIAVNGAANLLHFASAAVLLAVGLGARR